MSQLKEEKKLKKQPSNPSDEQKSTANSLRKRTSLDTSKSTVSSTRETKLKPILISTTPGVPL